jgi:hypothetical protein
MSVPRTRTHAVSLFNHQHAIDDIGKRPLAELRHPVQRITRRDGSGDPQKYGYDGFYELEYVIGMLGHPLFPFDLNDFDDVKWEELDQRDVQPSNYSSETPRYLETQRALRRRAKNREEENERYRRNLAVRQSALQLEQAILARSAQNSAIQPPSQTLFYTINAFHKANPYGDAFTSDDSPHMGLGKRTQSGFMSAMQ